MIEGLVTALGIKFDLTGEEIADVIWLVAHIQAPDQVIEETDKPSEVKHPSSDGREAATGEADISREETEEPPQEPPDSSTDIELYLGGEGPGSSDLSFQVPDARSLREPLELARALKPLLRRVPSKTLEPVLDEEATVQRIADERIWAPVLQSALEPWFDLVLVVDESPSMLIWQRTVLEFQRVLEQYGVFRNVSTWSLTPEGNHDFKLSPGLGKIARNQRSHSASELIDSNGRRLVVIASDCVSPIWQHRIVLPPLKLWADNGPLVIAQMLPQWLWNRTALGVAAGAEFAGLKPGVPNKGLTTRPLSRRSKANFQEGIKVPVVTLQSEEFGTWADMLTGKGNAWTKGFVYSQKARNRAAISPIREVPVNLTAEERVQRFRVTASPMARILAGLLASAPVINLPIVRIVQDRLLKDSKQVHVAEVFLGGLLEQTNETDIDIEPYKVQFDFHKGVRSLLLNSVPKSETIEIINEVSAYIAERLGLKSEEFAALLRDPKNAKNQQIGDRFIHSFARVTTEILRPLGGEYTRFVEELEDTYNSAYRTSELDSLKVEPAIDSYPNVDTIVDCQIMITNERGKRTASAINLCLQDSPDGDYLPKQRNIAVTKTLAGGQCVTCSIPVEVRPRAQQSGVFVLYYQISYSTRIGAKSHDGNFPVRLYPADEFNEINNPYVFYANGGIVDDVHMFYGRDQLIQNLVSGFNENLTTLSSFIIYGQKRIGKSSILHHIKTLLKFPTIPIHFSIGDIVHNFSIASFLYLIIVKIEDEFQELVDKGLPIISVNRPTFEEVEKNPQLYFQDFMSTLRRSLGHHEIYRDCQIILLIDEFSYIYGEIRRGKIEDTFMRFWKALLQRAYFSSVLAGQDIMPKFISSFPNEFMVARAIRVSYLDKESAQELIIHPIRIPGTGESRYRGNAVNSLFELTAGSPFYIQIFCSRLVEYMNRKKSTYITDADIEQVKEELVAGNNSLTEAQFDNLISASDSNVDEISREDAKSVLRKIANGSRIQENCARNAIDVETITPIDTILDDLCNREVIIRRSGTLFQIKVKLFKEWLLAN